MLRHDKRSAVVGAPRIQVPQADIGCPGCGVSPAGCTCGTVPSGPVPIIVPPVGIDVFPAAMAGDGISAARQAYARAVGGMNLPCVPYKDDKADCRNMTIVPGALVSIAPGATETVTIGAVRGLLDVFYIDIVFLTDVGVPLDPRIFTMTRPRVADCPTPCTDGAAPASMYAGIDGCCCGRPFRALIGRTTDGEDLTFDVTNHGAAAAEIFPAVRGFCYQRNLCIS